MNVAARDTPRVRRHDQHAVFMDGNIRPAWQADDTLTRQDVVQGGVFAAAHIEPIALDLAEGEGFDRDVEPVEQLFQQKHRESVIRPPASVNLGRRTSRSCFRPDDRTPGCDPTTPR